MNADEYMHTNMGDWPYALMEYAKHVCKAVGFCGDVLHSCCEEYVNAGEPDLATGLIDTFDTKLKQLTVRVNPTVGKGI